MCECLLPEEASLHWMGGGGNPFYTGNLAIGVDPDEMPQNAAFHQDLHCFLVKIRERNTTFRVITVLIKLPCEENYSTDMRKNIAMFMILTWSKDQVKIINMPIFFMIYTEQKKETLHLFNLFQYLSYVIKNHIKLMSFQFAEICVIETQLQHLVFDW